MFKREEGREGRGAGMGVEGENLECYVKTDMTDQSLMATEHIKLPLAHLDTKKAMFIGFDHVRGPPLKTISPGSC